MILDMIGAKLNARCVGAATACLVALALFVGPLCAGMCAGSICAARAANSNNEGARCHGMAHGKGAQVSVRDLNGACRGAEANLAVAGKPDFSVKRETVSSERKVFAVTIPNVASVFAADSRLFLSSDGPPPGQPGPALTGLVLRI